MHQIKIKRKEQIGELTYKRNNTFFISSSKCMHIFLTDLQFEFRHRFYNKIAHVGSDI